MVELVISKTIYNQNGRTPTTIFPQKWMQLKTVHFHYSWSLAIHGII